MTDLHVVLVQPEIPHNTGAIGRLCVALDCPLHLIRPLGFALRDAAIRRAGLDYWPRVRLAVHDRWEDFLQQARPTRLLLASTHGTRPHWEFPARPGAALVFGSESAGLPEALRTAHAADLYRIPMPGADARSLNLATAAAIVLYEAYRQLTTPATTVRC